MDEKEQMFGSPEAEDLVKGEELLSFLPFHLPPTA